jgi:integrase/recombinase XerD
MHNFELSISNPQRTNQFLDLSIIPSLKNCNTGKALSENSIESYTTTGKQLNYFLEKNELPLNIDSINSFLNSNSWNPNTINLKRQAIFNILKNQNFGDISAKELHVIQYAMTEEFKKIKRIKTSQHITRDEYLTQEQIYKIMEFTRNKRYHLIIEFLFQTGCRISEMIDIEMKDIILNGTAKIRVVGKGNKERVVYAKKDLVEDITRHFKSTKYLFQTKNETKLNRIRISTDVKKIGKKAGYTISPHTFRHSCAMHLKAKGKSADYIQKYLGHSKVSITMEHYFHNNPESNIMELF